MSCFSASDPHQGSAPGPRWGTSPRPPQLSPMPFTPGPPFHTSEYATGCRDRACVHVAPSAATNPHAAFAHHYFCHDGRCRFHGAGRSAIMPYPLARRSRILTTTRKRLTRTEPDDVSSGHEFESTVCDFRRPYDIPPATPLSPDVPIFEEEVAPVATVLDEPQVQEAVHDVARERCHAAVSADEPVMVPAADKLVSSSSCRNCPTERRHQCQQHPPHRSWQPCSGC